MSSRFVNNLGSPCISTHWCLLVIKAISVCLDENSPYWDWHAGRGGSLGCQWGAGQAGVKQGGLELVWWVLSSGYLLSVLCSMPIHFLQHSLSPISNRIAFAFWFVWFLMSGHESWWWRWWQQGSFSFIWRKWSGFSSCCVPTVPADGIASWIEASR